MLIKCPECQREVSDTAPSCPGCGYALISATAPTGGPAAPGAPASAPNPIVSKKKRGCLPWVLGGLGVFFAIGIIGSALKPASDVKPATTTPATSSASTAPKPGAIEPAQAANWTYETTKDPMSDKPTKTACTTSTNEVTQSFPYHDSTGVLCIRQSPKFGLDAYIGITDGQILCDLEGCRLPIRFDQAAVEKYPADGPSDHSTNSIFVNRTPGFIAALKKSSKMAVDLTLYDNGVQTLTFNTAGLEWPQ